MPAQLQGVAAMAALESSAVFEERAQARERFAFKFLAVLVHFGVIHS